MGDVIRLRNLPWDVPATILAERLCASLPGLQGLLGPLAVEELRIGPRNYAKSHRMMLHEGTAALQFVDAAAAETFCVSMEGGVILPSCGPRRIFANLLQPECPPCDPNLPYPRQPTAKPLQRRVHQASAAQRRARGELVDATTLLLAPPAELVLTHPSTCEGDWLDACHWQLPADARACMSAKMAWESMPAKCDPQSSAKKMADGSLRGARKREQVTEFVCVLDLLLRDATRGGNTVVDAGCGSGNLLLPLAFKFPGLRFLGLDIKPAAVALLKERAATAGLTNVSALAVEIDAYDPHAGGGEGGACDAVIAVLALHACGGASDAAIRLAARARAPFAISPCCIGKVNQALAPWEIGLGAVDGGGVRGGAQSRWLSTQLATIGGGLGNFVALATVADSSSHGSATVTDGEMVRRTKRAKTVLELDRLMASAEAFADINAADALTASESDRSVRGLGRLLRMGGSSMVQYTQCYTDLLVSPTPALLACLVPASVEFQDGACPPLLSPALA